MTSKYAIGTLGTHAGLLLLASTRFSIVSWIWGKSAWTWDYFQYAHRNGWGYEYESDYSLGIVLTYMTAFAVGAVGYAMAGNRIPRKWTMPPMMLCVLGLISFLIEGSHWLWEHHLSWIVISPAASLVLAALAIVRLGKRSQTDCRDPGGSGSVDNRQSVVPGR